MKPITPMNNWILSKISTFLRNNEGCTVDTIVYTQDGAKANIQDAFGFRYEVEIKTVGRLQDDPGDMERFNSAFKSKIVFL